MAVFVVETSLMNAAGPVRRDQLLAHLHAVNGELRARGGGLVVLPGPAAAAIPRAISECEASLSPYARIEPRARPDDRAYMVTFDDDLASG